MADRYDFEIEQGSTFALTIIWKDAGGQPVPVELYQAALWIKEKKADADSVALAKWNSTDGSPVITLESSTGSISINAPASVTSALSFNSALYDLKMLRITTQTIQRIVEGNVTLDKQVTTLGSTPVTVTFGKRTLTAGEDIDIYDPVYITSAGTIWQAQANLWASSLAMGCADESILSGSSGVVTTIGTITEVADTFAAGDEGKDVFLSAATAGAISLTPALSSGQVVKRIGTVVSTGSSPAYVLDISEGQQL